MWTLSFSYKV